MFVNYEKLGMRIKKTRETKHLSQAELAEAAETSVQHISNIETAKKTQSFEVVVKIASALETSVDKLLCEDKTVSYSYEIENLLADSSEYELAVILDQARSIKKSLRENEHLLSQNKAI